jgi:Lrp/AsnC family leucine-responsive transcriptional regulator
MAIERLIDGLALLLVVRSRIILQMPSDLLLDNYDTRILAELQADARLSLAELGRRVHLSQPAVSERVRKLEAAGVITGYRATVNLAALGYGIRALVRVGRTDYASMVRLIADTPEIVNVWNVTGEDSWVLEIAVVDVAHLDAVVSALCLLAQTSTSIILKTLREHQVMLPARPLSLALSAQPVTPAATQEHAP